ncbi:MAG TPA: ABC transporter substrate-binding protein [Bacteroidia bacterium]|nr:ABC transporter substrate-binding protein [Bacteroidia bacterium]
MKNSKILFAFSLIIIVITGCISCNEKGKKNNNEEIKIGAIFDLTGSLSYMGKWSQDGAMQAVENINKNGGIDGRIVKLIFEDGGSDANKCVSAVRKLIDNDKVSLIIGFSSSSSVMASAPIANSDKVVILATATGSPNITDAGDYIFRNRLSGKLEVEAISKFIAVDRNQKDIGVIYINNDYGNGYAKIFHSSFESHGGKILLEEGFEQDQTDFKTLVKKFKDNNIKNIYLVAFAKEGGNLLKQCFEQNYMPQWYCANPIEAPEFLKIAGAATEGVIYSVARYDPNDSLSMKFNSEYKAKHGYDSEMFAANTYDAVNIGAMAIAKTDGSGEKIKTFLYDSVQNYPGAAGLTSFDNNGDILKPVMMKTIKDGKFITLEK